MRVVVAVLIAIVLVGVCVAALLVVTYRTSGALSLSDAWRRLVGRAPYF